MFCCGWLRSGIAIMLMRAKEKLVLLLADSILFQIFFILHKCYPIFVCDGKKNLLIHYLHFSLFEFCFLISHLQKEEKDPIWVKQNVMLLLRQHFHWKFLYQWRGNPTNKGYFILIDATTTEVQLLDLKGRWSSFKERKLENVTCLTST